MVQIILGIIALVAVGGITFLIYTKRKNERPDLDYLERVSLDSLLGSVKREMSELIKDDDLLIANDLHFEAVSRNKRRIEQALTDCIFGIKSAKRIVIAQIREIIERLLPEERDVYQVIDFSEAVFLEPYFKWEILIYKLKKRIKDGKIMEYLDDEYHLSSERVIVDPLANDPLHMQTVKRRVFDATLLDEIFMKEVLHDQVTGETLSNPLDYNEMLDVISIILFERYKGIGVVGTLKELDIDGFHFGTSGSIRYKIDGNYDAPYRTTNSVWVQIKAQWIHFSFIDFYKEEEMKRIVNQMVSWGNAAPMTEKNPSKVNDDAEGNRITAIRPSAGECWAVFCRKFSAGIYHVPLLLNKHTPEVINEQTGEVIRPAQEKMHNWELVDRLVYYLMQSERTVAFTGQQNTGKTSFMKAAIEYTPRMNIRILEMSFELALREIYPDRDTYDVKPTDYISSSALQDLLKKTDGWMSMVGEVAEDIVAARMIQFCLIASAFTIFSHHGKDDDGLINGLTNSLVASGEYTDHAVAKATVLDAIKHNVHLNFCKGERVVEYVSEIVKRDEISAYPEVSKLWQQAERELLAIKLKHEGRSEAEIKYIINQTNGNSRGIITDEAISSYVNTLMNREYYTRRTDRVTFDSRYIIKFNRDTMTYEPYQWYTKETFEQMIDKMSADNRKSFVKFYNDNWRGRCVS